MPAARHIAILLCVLLVVGVLAGLTAGRPLAHAARAADPAAQIDAWRSRGRVPAVSVAIQRPGAPPWTHTSGSAALDGSGAVGPSTQLRIASITKMFVAAVVGQLVEEGRLDLDAPVSRLLPGKPLLEDVTVRHLLNHSSGLPEYGVPELSQQLVDDPQRVWSTEAVLATLEHRRREFAPGTQWTYSNTGYLVLSQVIEAITGRTWVEELRERILDPLRLDDTYVAGQEPPRGRGLVHAAYFDLDDDGVVEDVEDGTWPALETSEGAAGAVVSTADDVARFTTGLFTGSVVSERYRQAMVARTPFARRSDDYGLGVEVVRPDLQTTVWGHGGFLPGHRSVTWYVPSLRTTITVLVNHSLADPSDLARLLLAGLLDEPGGR